MLAGLLGPSEPQLGVSAGVVGACNQGLPDATVLGVSLGLMPAGRWCCCAGASILCMWAAQAMGVQLGHGRAACSDPVLLPAHNSALPAAAPGRHCKVRTSAHTGPNREAWVHDGLVLNA